MKFKNIKEITNWVFAGNAMSDQSAFEAIDAFCSNTNNSENDRAESLRIMYDKGMDFGRQQDLNNIKLINDFMAQKSN